MKYISFAIPCYNSAAYMDRAVESILKGGEDVEIIIVNDGSKDDTSKIAHEYEEKYPTIVRAVDKENGGHGDAVNVGLDHAEGKYFKVVDSDDWVDEEALYKILDVLKTFENEEKQVDMLLANYVYEKEGMEHKKVIEYKNVLPQEEIFGWNDVKHFHLGQYILMHSVIYRTDFLNYVSSGCRSIRSMWTIFMFTIHFRMCVRCITWMWIFIVITLEEKISLSMKR